MRIRILAAATAAAVTAGGAQAASFGVYDARSVSMGNIGTSAGNPSNASFYNPALLGAPQEDADFNLEIPMISFRAAAGVRLFDLLDLGLNYERLDAAAGADDVVVIHTTPGLLHLSPEAFVRDVLVDHLGPSHVVEGPNFFFGHHRAGNVDTLADLGREMGFEAHVVEPVTVELADGTVTRVSSSLVRHLLGDGKIEDAAHCLGRPHTLRGLVVRGRGIGRELHVETANLDCEDQLLPADGVYAAWADLNGQTRPAAVNVGERPTFGLHERAVEAHLLGHEGTLYGRRLALRLIKRLRPQRTFDSPDALRRQIAEDIACVREELH
ncbi:MAG: riboflavin kinase [Thiohalospira sp.]